MVGSPPKLDTPDCAITADWYSLVLIHKGACQRSHSQCARPMWSGCMWVAITRKMGRPCKCVASMLSQASRVAGLSIPQSTAVQPSCIAPVWPWGKRSRSSHRLMWSSAKGRPMRNHSTPGATSITPPDSGNWSPNG
jgi:hypothetical protein